jgi:membrane protein YqaA with SNARE-associated domain
MSEQQQIEERIQRLRILQKTEREKISLFWSPLLTIKYSLIVSWINFIKAKDYCLQHSYIFFSVAFILLAFVVSYVTPGPHQSKIAPFEEFVVFATWWITLGVLSSIGMGTGLHTFVLYLGPHIAKVTLTATECNSVNFETVGPDSFLCPPVEEQTGVEFWDILRKVQLEAILWGLGTAIGELPPYFVARAARHAGESIQELEELRDLQQNPETLMDQAKKLGLKIVTRMGFFGILIFASVPNPLFDLAGITCGHFLVPFWTFFGATAIGKGLIKAHLQAFFVISMFSVSHLETIIHTFETYAPFGSGALRKMIEEEKAKLHAGHGHTQQHTMLGKFYDLFLILMIGYFVVSLINSSVQGYLAQRDEEKLARLRENPSELDQALNAQRAK